MNTIEPIRVDATRAHSPTPHWSLILAADINNQFELGLSDRQLRSLAFVIARRAENGGDRP